MVNEVVLISSQSLWFSILYVSLCNCTIVVLFDVATLLLLLNKAVKNLLTHAGSWALLTLHSTLEFLHLPLEFSFLGLTASRGLNHIDSLVDYSLPSLKVLVVIDFNVWQQNLPSALVLALIHFRSPADLLIGVRFLSRNLLFIQASHCTIVSLEGVFALLTVI